MWRIIPPEQLSAELVALAKVAKRVVVEFERGKYDKDDWDVRIVRDDVGEWPCRSWAAASTPELALAAAMDELEDFASGKLEDEPCA